MKFFDRWDKNKPSRGDRVPEWTQQTPISVSTREGAGKCIFSFSKNLLNKRFESI